MTISISISGKLHSVIWNQDKKEIQVFSVTDEKTVKVETVPDEFTLSNFIDYIKKIELKTFKTKTNGKRNHGHT